MAQLTLEQYKKQLAATLEKHTNPDIRKAIENELSLIRMAIDGMLKVNPQAFIKRSAEHLNKLIGSKKSKG